MSDAEPVASASTTAELPDRVSRRQLFTMAAGAAGVATGATLLAARPAAAEDLDPVLQGAVNVYTNPTILRSVSGALELESSSSTQPALKVWAKNTAFAANGISVSTDTLGLAIRATANNTGGAILAEVIPAASGATALRGATAGNGHALVAETTKATNPNVSMYATTAGLGGAVSAEITNAANSDTAVLAATAGTGSGVVSQVNNAGERWLRRARPD